MKHELRNTKRGVSDAEARSLLESGEYGILSTVDADGQPYGIPLSYCAIGDALYFHSAVAGHKLENIAANDRVSFCVVGATEVLPEQFATRYESVVVTGRATEVLAAEKQLGLEGLLRKYSAGFQEAGLQYITAAWEKTRVYRVSIEHVSGKARR